MKTVEVKIEGIAPLLMHAGHLADPTNPWVKAIKEISGKRKKTDADLEELKRLELLGGLYWDDDMGVFIPDTWVEKNIRDGAADSKNGKKVLSGVISDDTKFKLNYDGIKGIQTRDDLYKDDFIDTRGVVIQRARIMRTRPIFRNWSCTFVINIAEEVISVADVEKALNVAGMLKGIGDYRPKFGRYSVESFNVLN